MNLRHRRLVLPLLRLAQALDRRRLDAEENSDEPRRRHRSEERVVVGEIERSLRGVQER